MENAGCALRPEFLLHEMKDVFEVADEGRPVVMVEAMGRVAAVIAKVEQNQLVALAQRSPERQIAVDCQAVAVAQRQPRSAGIAVLADADYRPIVHRGVDRSEWCRYLATQFAFLAISLLRGRAPMLASI